ncbi:heparinase II/III family protein [Gellertiella hungarica]|uniref:heparinase II/III family protein n=1 Tax=Gellertiella hungarica TaxID=1572859 RepID=UPI0035EF7C37
MLAGGQLYRAYLSEARRRVHRSVALTRLRLFRASVRAPERLIVAPTDLRPIDAFVAEEILEGRFPLAGRVLDTNGTSPFFLELPSRPFAMRLHAFSWIRHLRALRSPEASAAARTIVNQWLSTHGRVIDGIAWEPETVASRLIAWLSHSPVLLNGADTVFYRRFSRSLVYQGRYLERLCGSAIEPETRFRIRIALAMLTLAVPSRAGQIRKAAARLDQEIEAQILADGGHVSRNPRAALDLLLDLLPLRQTYMNLGHDMPQRLISGIDRMYPALRFFRHQGGDLALFNGATATLANELMAVLRYDETSGQTFKALPHMGYQRMASGQTVVIVDSGMAQDLETSRTAHAGTLSFEMSAGKNRFIVNAGSPRFAGNHYRQMARASAAHSTVILNETSSSRLSQSSYLGPVMAEGPKHVTVRREESAEGEDRLDMSHDGYAGLFGLVHHRHLRLSQGGTRLGGRDFFTRPGGETPGAGETATAIARFHVHPAIDLIQAGRDSVLLKAPDGESWLFSVDGHEAVISEDIFFADASGIRASEQIEVRFSLAEHAEIDWQFIRQR